MRYLGDTARKLRTELGLTQQAVADALGISVVHLCNIENDKAMPSAGLLDRYRKLYGVDLYVLSWCEHPEVSKLPKAVREAAAKLASAWTGQLNRKIRTHRDKAGRPCSASND